MVLRTLVVALALGSAGTIAARGGVDDDLARARELFEANLAAIERQDRDAYLATDWQ